MLQTSPPSSPSPHFPLDAQTPERAECIFAQDPNHAERTSYLPVARTIGYTLQISAQFLTSALLGDGTIQRSDTLLHWWSKKIFQSGNAELVAIGREHLDIHSPYVFMSNHRSLLDIPASIAATPQSVRMVMKQELTRVPIWGRAMVASGFVPVDRRNKEKAIEQLERAKDHLHHGVSVWVFPEGTRSRDGSLGPFKNGGFHVAKQLGFQIVPTWIEGTAAAVPADSFLTHYHQKCSVRYGVPIRSTGKDLETLMEEVRVAIEALRPKGAEQESV